MGSLDFWPQDYGAGRATDNVFQHYPVGSLAQDILPKWQALYRDKWPCILPRVDGVFLPLARAKPSVEIALNGDFCEVRSLRLTIFDQIVPSIIFSSFQVIMYGSSGFGGGGSLVWLAFRKQHFVAKCLEKFQAMERKFEDAAMCEAEYEEPVSGNEEDEDDEPMLLEDYLYSECFDD